MLAPPAAVTDSSEERIDIKVEDARARSPELSRMSFDAEYTDSLHVPLLHSQGETSIGVKVLSSFSSHEIENWHVFEIAGMPKTPSRVRASYHFFFRNYDENQMSRYKAFVQMM